jgi:hypothetical protein
MDASRKENGVNGQNNHRLGALCASALSAFIDMLRN